MTIIEQNLQGKKNAETCEDNIVVSADFAAVIDGSTAKGKRLWQGKRGGRFAMELISEAILSMPSTLKAEEAAEYLSAPIYNRYNREGLLDEVRLYGENRLTCSAVVYSRQRKEIWSFGDCQFRFGGRTYRREKLVDGILTQIRCDALRQLIANGHTETELETNDLARQLIFDALRDQCSFQNSPTDNPYAYPVIDGFPINPHQITVTPLSQATPHLILASDGYPELFDTLRQSEDCLQRMLQTDPLCYQLYPATKGRQAGNSSFDDRAFLKLNISDDFRT